MQNLYEVLRFMGFSDSDFVVSDIEDGNGPFVSAWYSGSPQPTEGELLAEEVNYLAAEAALEVPRAQALAYREIDQAAERARLRYITDGAGQAQTYQEKSEEAADYVAAGYPADTSNYPFVQADANAYVSTPTEAADYILLKRSEWVVLGSAIEEIRLGGKKIIFDAVDTATIETTRVATIAALDLI